MQEIIPQPTPLWARVGRSKMDSNPARVVAWSASRDDANDLLLEPIFLEEDATHAAPLAEGYTIWGPWEDTYDAAAMRRRSRDQWTEMSRTPRSA